MSSMKVVYHRSLLTWGAKGQLSKARITSAHSAIVRSLTFWVQSTRSFLGKAGSVKDLSMTLAPGAMELR